MVKEIISISDSDDEIEITGYKPPAAPKDTSQTISNTPQPTSFSHVRASYNFASTSSQPASANPLKRKAAREGIPQHQGSQKRQFIEISDDEDPHPPQRPRSVKQEPRPLKKEPQSIPTHPRPQTPIPETNKSPKLSPSPSVMELDFPDEADLSDEVILTETEYFSDEEDHPPRPINHLLSQHQTYLPPEPVPNPEPEALTLTQHGGAITAHSDSFVVDYSQLANILPAKLVSTTDHLIAHFCQLKLGAPRVEGIPKTVPPKLKPPTFSKSRRQSGKQSLRAQRTFHLGGAGIEALAISRLGVMASSSTKGGDALDNELDPDPYNMPNNLAMYSPKTDRVHYLNEHSRQFDRAGRKAIKYYAVSNVAANLIEHRDDLFYSAGHDGCLREWKVTADQCIEVAKKTFVNGPPYYLACNPDPDTSLLAVGCMDGSLFYAKTPWNAPDAYHKLNLVEDGSAKAGNLAWGTGPSKSLLFSCVESLIEGSRATNKYFDIRTNDSSSFAPPGLDSNNLALSNCGSSISLCAHNLELDLGQILFFDIRTRPKPTRTLSMGPHISDVCTMAFSPDDIYLALGKENNTVEVWDTRYATSSPMLQLRHFDGILPQDESFGIARHIQWVERRHRFGTGLGLVTAGDGGSLRLWDVQRAGGIPGDQHVLAECAFSITTLLIPEPTLLHEVRAVVGDAGGNVTMYQ